MYHLYVIVIQLQFSSLNYTISHVQASVPPSVNTDTFTNENKNQNDFYYVCVLREHKPCHQF